MWGGSKPLVFCRPLLFYSRMFVAARLRAGSLSDGHAVEREANPSPLPSSAAFTPRQTGIGPSPCVTWAARDLPANDFILSLDSDGFSRGPSAGHAPGMAPESYAGKARVTQRCRRQHRRSPGTVTGESLGFAQPMAGGIAGTPSAQRQGHPGLLFTQRAIPSGFGRRGRLIS